MQSLRLLFVKALVLRKVRLKPEARCSGYERYLRGGPRLGTKTEDRKWLPQSSCPTFAFRRGAMPQRLGVENKKFDQSRSSTNPSSLWLPTNVGNQSWLPPPATGELSFDHSECGQY